MCAYCGLALYGSIIYSPTHEFGTAIKWTTLIASALPMVQSILQSSVIWKIRKGTRELSEEDINMWIILSFAIWLFDSFSAKEYSTNNIQTIAFPETWNYLADIFVPMAIFFRFHSCIVFANIKAGVYYHRQYYSEV